MRCDLHARRQAVGLVVERHGAPLVLPVEQLRVDGPLALHAEGLIGQELYNDLRREVNSRRASAALVAWVSVASTASAVAVSMR